MIVATTQLLNESGRLWNSENQSENETTRDNILMRLESLMGLLEEVISVSNPDNHDILLSLRRQVDAEICPSAVCNPSSACSTCNQNRKIRPTFNTYKCGLCRITAWSWIYTDRYSMCFTNQSYNLVEMPTRVIHYIKGIFKYVYQIQSWTPLLDAIRKVILIVAKQC